MSTFEQQFAELHRMARGEDTTAGAIRQSMEGKGMTRERLMEIRETLSNGDHLTRLDCAHLLAMIDSALAEPSDEDIDRALDWILTGKYETQVGDHSYVADSRFHPDTSRLCNTIAQALRQYQKPTDEAPTVGDMHDYALRQMRTEPCGWCEWTDNGYRIEYNLIDEDGNCCPDMDNVVVTGIATYCPSCGRKLVKHDG